MVYHAGLQQVLLVDTRTQTRIWAWDGSAWSVISAGGPSARQYAAVAYDLARDRLVLFGGNVADTTYLADTWEWDGAVWAQRAVPGPSPRSNHGMAYDESRHRTVLFGGYFQPPGHTLSDTWEWDGQAWTQVATTGPGPSSVETPLAYDSLRARTVFYRLTALPSQLWDWDGVQWVQESGSTPPVLASWMVYDPARARLVLSGSGIWEFDPATGQSTQRQPGSGFDGLAAFDAGRSRAVIASTQTLEYNGAASDISAYIAGQLSGDGTYAVGSTIVLSVPAGGSAPLSFQWRRDQQPLSDGSRISGATTATLTITDAAMGDNGNYDVIVSNACATTSPWYALSVVVSPACYANCDGSTAPPILTVNDFVCFQAQFAAGHAYANCDHSFTVPILNVNDFVCFMAFFAQGCP
jgi:hypothetical protein